MIFWPCTFVLSPRPPLSSKSQTSPLKGQRLRPHMYRRDKRASDIMGTRLIGAPHLGEPSRLIHHCNLVNVGKTQGQQHSRAGPLYQIWGKYLHIIIIFLMLQLIVQFTSISCIFKSDWGPVPYDSLGLFLVFFGC